MEDLKLTKCREMIARGERDASQCIYLTAQEKTNDFFRPSVGITNKAMKFGSVH